LKEGEGCLEEEKYAVARQRIQGWFYIFLGRTNYEVRIMSRRSWLYVLLSSWYFSEFIFWLHMLPQLVLSRKEIQWINFPLNYHIFTEIASTVGTGQPYHMANHPFHTLLNVPTPFLESQPQFGDHGRGLLQGPG
jgi:hypothetical protein